MQHIDIIQPGGFARLGLAAIAWIVDRDAWGWACGAMAILSFFPLADARRTRFETRRAIAEFGGWSASVVLCACYRTPAMRWLEDPTLESVLWQAQLALFAWTWLIGAMLIAAAVASLFDCRVQNRGRGAGVAGEML